MTESGKAAPIYVNRRAELEDGKAGTSEPQLRKIWQRARIKDDAWVKTKDS
jgi:hypothetical protein